MITGQDLADHLGYVQLTDPVRFKAAWERKASLRLRAGWRPAACPRGRSPS